MEIRKILTYAWEMLPYLGVTFSYVGGAFLLGLTLGLVLLAMRRSHIKVLNVLGSLYVNVIRCIPSIVLLFLVYYGLPAVAKARWGITIPSDRKLIYVILTFGLFQATTVCEVFRSSLNAVGRGQYEAGACVGLTRAQTNLQIVFPQALRMAVPNLANSLMFLIKDGALAYTVGIQDVFGRGQMVNSLSYGADTLEIYLAMFCIYWPLIMILEQVFGRLEKYLGHETKKKRSGPFVYMGRRLSHSS